MKPLKSGLALGAISAVVVAGAATAPMASALTTAASGPSVRPAIAAAQASAGDTARALRLDSREQLKVKDVVTDRDGSTHVRYERTFAGLRVIGGDFVVHRTSAGASDRQLERLRPRRRRLHDPRVAAATARATGARTARPGQEGRCRRARRLRRRGQPRGSRTTCSSPDQGRPDAPRLHTIVDATSGATLARWDDIEEGRAGASSSATSPSARP